MIGWQVHRYLLTTGSSSGLSAADEIQHEKHGKSSGRKQLIAAADPELVPDCKRVGVYDVTYGLHSFNAERAHSEIVESMIFFGHMC